MEVLLLVGNSNAGKDYIAEHRFKNFTLLKLNQPFKNQFEQDHFLQPGACNDKSRRAEIILKGPLRNYAIQEAMVISYNQSLKGCGYGAKFVTLPILKTLEALDSYSKKRIPVVITDLRKLAELKFILEFCKLIDYNVRMIHVHSDKETPYESDESLYDNKAFFERYTRKTVETCQNNYA